MKLFPFLAAAVMGIFGTLLVLAVVIAFQKTPHKIPQLSAVKIQELRSKAL